MQPIHTKTFPPLHLCAAKEAGRYSMHHILIDKVEGEPEQFDAVATDGRRLVIVRMAAQDGDVSGMIPRDAFAAAAKCKIPKRGDFAPSMIANGDVTVQQTPTVKQKFAREDVDGEFPRYKNVIPQWAHDPWVGPQGRVVVSFNPQYLLEIAQALGTDDAQFSVNLEFEVEHEVIEQLERDASGKPIVVTDDMGNATTKMRQRSRLRCTTPIVVKAKDREHNLGVLMPCVAE